MMYIDLERDSVIRVQALMTLAAYSVQQIKNKFFSAFAYPRLAKYAISVSKYAKSSLKAFFLLHVLKLLTIFAVVEYEGMSTFN